MCGTGLPGADTAGANGGPDEGNDDDGGGLFGLGVLATVAAGVGGLAVLLLVGWFLCSSRAQETTAASAGSGGQGQRRSRDIMCERGQSFKA